MKDYIGVEWSRREQCFKSYIKLQNKKILVGVFVEQLDAVKARDKYILKHGLKCDLQFYKSVKNDKTKKV